MEKPLFSVIITTYNRAKLLPRAMQSVFDQTVGDFEFLVIDNGSTDNTEEIVRAVKDNRVKYVRNPVPTDSCDAPRNLGINIANGAFISFLDDDDTWYPTKLEKVKKILDENPKLEAVCNNENKNINGRMEGILRKGPWIKEDIYEKLLYKGNCFSPSGMTIKKDLLRRLNGFALKEEFAGAADYELWIRMARQGVEFHFIEEPLGESYITGYNFFMKDRDFDFKIANLVRLHILENENKRMFGISKMGMWRMLQLYAIAGRSYTKARLYKKAVSCYGKTAFFLLRRPSLIFKLMSKITHVEER